jgi:hypothetical protein
MLGELWSRLGLFRFVSNRDYSLFNVVAGLILAKVSVR